MTTRSTRASAKAAPEGDKSGHKEYADSLKVLEKLNKKRKTAELTDAEEDEFLKQLDSVKLHIAKKRSVQAGEGSSGVEKTLESEGADVSETDEPEETGEEESTETEEVTEEDDGEEEVSPEEDEYFENMVLRQLNKLKKNKSLPDDFTVDDLRGDTSDKGKSLVGDKQPPAKRARTEEADAVLAQASQLASEENGDDMDKRSFLNQYVTIKTEPTEDLPPVLIEILNTALKGDLDAAQMKEIADRNPVPGNFPEKVARVNKAIWGPLRHHVHQIDFGLMHMQEYILKALVPIMRLINIKADERDEETTQALTDVLKTLGMGFRFAYNKRKELLKPELNDQYKELCSPKIPVEGEWLFGDDLSKHVTEVEATTKITKAVTKPPPRKVDKLPTKPKQKSFKPSKDFFKKKANFFDDKASNPKPPPKAANKQGAPKKK